MCEGRIEKSVPRMTNGDPEGRFLYPTLTRIMESFFLAAVFIYLF